MNNDEGLRRRVADIGRRFLARTEAEAEHMRQELDALQQGAAEAQKRIEEYAHRIYGGAAMFGFAAVGEVAREIELLAASDSPDKVQLEALLSRLSESVREAQNTSSAP